MALTLTQDDIDAIAEAVALAILVTPANKLATGADGSIDGLSANAQQDVADALSVTPMVLP